MLKLVLGGECSPSCLSLKNLQLQKPQHTFALFDKPITWLKIEEYKHRAKGEKSDTNLISVQTEISRGEEECSNRQVYSNELADFFNLIHAVWSMQFDLWISSLLFSLLFTFNDLSGPLFLRQPAPVVT